MLGLGCIVRGNDLKNENKMNAKEYYESREWGNPHWDRKTATQFDKSEMLDFAEHYHQAKLKLLGIGIVGSSASSCGCKDKQLYHVKVHWGMGEQREFNYCKDCIEQDTKKGMLVEIL